MVDTGTKTTLTFDVVGTVIDFETGILNWLGPHLRGHGVEVADGEILEAFAAAEDELQRRRPELPFTAMLPRIYQALAARWALPGDADAAAAFRDSIPDWPAFPDSAAALARLGRRYRLIAVTNADAWACDAMDRTVGGLFDGRVTCDEVGVNKPDPRVFRHVLDKYALDADEVLHFGQSQYHDIGGARAFGLATAWVERRRDAEGWGATPTPARVVEPDLHVASLADLADRLLGPA